MLVEDFLELMNSYFREKYLQREETSKVFSGLDGFLSLCSSLVMYYTTNDSSVFGANSSCAWKRLFASPCRWE